MQLQQLDPKFITVTQLRRDIDILEKILEKYEEAWVIKNQDVLFIAMSPKKYLKLTGKTNFPNLKSKK